MDENEIIDRVAQKLEPEEFRMWFMRSLPEIRDVVLTVAKVDGIDQAVKDVKELFLAWLQQPKL